MGNEADECSFGIQAVQCRVCSSGQQRLPPLGGGIQGHLEAEQLRAWLIFLSFASLVGTR